MRAAVAAPRLPRVGLQLVVDVHGAQPRPRRAAQLRARRQQRGGIEAAAEGDAQADVGVAGQQLRELPARATRAELILFAARGCGQGA